VKKRGGNKRGNKKGENKLTIRCPLLFQSSIPRTMRRREGGVRDEDASARDEVRTRERRCKTSGGGSRLSHAPRETAGVL